MLEGEIIGRGRRKNLSRAKWRRRTRPKIWKEDSKEENKDDDVEVNN